jgi:hypothetical protein
MFPICFYMPRFFEMRSKEDIKVIFTGSKALEISLVGYNDPAFNPASNTAKVE